MWFLVHCYEDQGKHDDALSTCGELLQLVHGFGGEGLGQKHKMWQLLLEKKKHLLSVKESQEITPVAGTVGDAYKLPPDLPKDPSLNIPPKRIITHFTY